MIIRRIITAIAPLPDQHLVEIGPGQGALTFPILKQLHSLDVIELDRDLIPHLQERIPRQGRLHIHQADALEFDFASLKTDNRPLRVFGNLPYNISTPLIFHLLEYTSIINDMIFMLQKEVAARLAAPPDTEHYARLSIMVQYHCEALLLFEVPPSAFYPQPKVTSAIVKLIPHRQPPVIAEDYTLFANVVRQAFSQRRKTLHNSLKHMVPDTVWTQLAIDPKLRPENLSVKDYVAISNALKG